MSEVRVTVRSRHEAGDWMITLLLLGVMIGAYVLARNWPGNAAFFPQLVSAAGAVLSVIKVGSMIWSDFIAPPKTVLVSEAAPAPGQAEDDEKQIAIAGTDDDDQGDEDELHSVFTTSGGKLWASAIAWMTLFFVGLYTFGLLVILPVFTILYLRFVARFSWLMCLLYVLGTAGVIYALFVLVLHLPLPEGVFPLPGG